MSRRTVRFSQTFNDQLIELLDWGERHFGERVAENKRQRVYATVEGLLATFPAIKQPHPELGLVAYPVTGTPFVLPPGTPKDRVDILKEAFRKTYLDPEFAKEYRRLTADDPSPLLPEIEVGLKFDDAETRAS